MTEADVVILDEKDVVTDKTEGPTTVLIREFHAISGNPSGKLAVVRWSDGVEFCCLIVDYKVQWQVTRNRNGFVHYYPKGPRQADREDMINFLVNDYPDSFEFVLFHPEILDGRYYGDKE